MQVKRAILGAVLILAACTAQPVPSQPDEAATKASIEAILAQLDQVERPAEELADLYTDDAVILRPGLPQVRGRDAVVALMEEQASGPELDMTHRLDEFRVHGDLIVVQGGVTGEARPADGSGPFAFATQNLILLKRQADGQLKIRRVIFNAAPPEDAPKS